ncbi:MAG: nitrilase-related carbon-nitrogen hydrolase [Campylobacterota bacterium]|nr:nitrilase-related carbon-nitrogen hydrolase [Campylobacterota bacterium]
MRVTLIQNAPKLNRSNLSDALDQIQQFAGSTDVIVFPELALNGYLLQDKVYEDAWKMEELGDLIAASHSVDIVIGAAMKIDGRTYNSGLYLSRGEISHLHHKVHLPNYGMFEEARYFFKGDQIETFQTRAGKTAMLVCEDLWRAQTVADLVAEKPDMLYVIANSPARDFSDKGLLIEAQWDALLKSAAILCSSYVVFINRVGFEDGLGFWGGSRVITPKGEVEHASEKFANSVETVKLSHSLHGLQKWMAKID